MAERQPGDVGITFREGTPTGDPTQWQVQSEEPLAPGAPPADPWKPVNEAPIAAAPDADAWKPTQEAPLSPDDQAAMMPETFVPRAAREFVEQAAPKDWKIISEAASGAATLPKRAIGAAQQYSDTGEYNPAPIVEAATLPMGTGAVAGVPVHAGEQVLGAGAVRTVKNILSPDTVAPVAEGAAADIRAAGGKAARDTEIARSSFDSMQRQVSALPDPEKLNLVDYIETRSKGNAPAIAPALQPVADTIRTEMEKRVTKLQSLSSTANMSFIEDYYPHMWQDPAQAATFVHNFSSGSIRQGSGASLKQRTVPTIADGIAAGLKPISTDPLEISMRYIQSMDRFIATQEVLEKAIAAGNVKYIKPNVMGASGNPGSFKTPPGWEPLNGRGATNAQGWKAYAPEDFARVYNNFIDAGIHRNADWGKVYDAARNTSNAITSLELGLSGFHAATMAQEAMVNAVAKGIGEIASGRPVQAIKSIASAPIKPVTNVLKGRKLEQVYLEKGLGTPLMRQITDLLTEAGGRAKGNKYAPDYQYTQASSYWDSFKRGSILAELKAADAQYAGKGFIGTGSTAVKQTFNTVGRVMQTVAQPLFEYTIPKLKNGAFFDNMASWLEANPLASHAEQVKAARTIWDSVDNRFGELVSDNIFWNKTLKQAAQVSLRSYSWALGTVRELGGGAATLARHPSSLSPKSKHYSPKAAYVIALPIVYATLNAVYQKLKTGKNPESISDVMRGGLTGGTVPGVGKSPPVPERIMLPGYMKDVFGWWNDPVSEATNKVATFPRMIKESVKNENWRGLPIRDVNAPTVDQVRQYLEYVFRTLGPISIKQIAQGQKTGSNISTGESLMGLHSAPSYLQDPEGLDTTLYYINQRKWKQKEKADEKEAVQHGVEPTPPPVEVKPKKEKKSHHNKEKGY